MDSPSSPPTEYSPESPVAEPDPHSEPSPDKPTESSPNDSSEPSPFEQVIEELVAEVVTEPIVEEASDPVVEEVIEPIVEEVTEPIVEEASDPVVDETRLAEEAARAQLLEETLDSMIDDESPEEPVEQLSPKPVVETTPVVEQTLETAESSSSEKPIIEEPDYDTDSDEETELTDHPPLEYLSVLMRLLLVWLFGMRTMLVLVTGYTAYVNPSWVTISLCAVVSYTAWFGVTTALSVVAGYLLLRAVENWTLLSGLLSSARLLDPRVNRVCTTAEQLVETVRVKSSEVITTVRQQPLVQKLAATMTLVYENRWVQRLLRLLDTLIGKLVKMVGSIAQRLEMQLPKLPTDGVTIEELDTDLPVEAESDAPLIEEPETGESDPNSDDTSGSEPTTVDETNTEEMMKRATVDLQKLDQMFKPFVDLNRLPPPPTNTAEMKKQMDMMIGLIQQTQSLQEMTSKMRRGGRRPRRQ